MSDDGGTGVVQVNQPGVAVQFTMGGMQILQDGGGGLVPTGEVIPHGLPAGAEEPPPAPTISQPSDPNQRLSFRTSVHEPVSQQHQPGGLKPQPVGVVLKQAKARLKEIKAELKYHAQLKKEAEELERLIKAAKVKPTNLRAVKRAG